METSVAAASSMASSADTSLVMAAPARSIFFSTARESTFSSLRGCILSSAQFFRAELPDPAKSAVSEPTAPKAAVEAAPASGLPYSDTGVFTAPVCGIFPEISAAGAVPAGAFTPGTDMEPVRLFSCLP